MKMNVWLASALIATTSMVTVAHADNGTRVAATSALGSVVGTAIGKVSAVHQVQQLVQL